MLRIEKLLAPIIKYAALFIGMLSILKIWTRKSENLAVAKDDLKEANQGVDDAIKTNEIGNIRWIARNIDLGLKPARIREGLETLL